VGIAFAPVGSGIAAGAGIHGRNEHEVGGIAVGLVDPADGHPLVLKGQPKGFEGFSPELRKLIKKEDASMGKRDFPGFCIGPSPDEGMGGHVVVG